MDGFFVGFFGGHHVEQELVIAEHAAQLLEHGLRDLDIVADVAQRRIDLMRDAGNHLAERSHFFRLHQLRLRGLELLVGFGEARG